MSVSEKRRALLAFTLVALSSSLPPAGVAVPPPPRSRAEIEAVLSRSPGPPPPERQRRLRIVLVANEKDHGPEEHDYPLWLARWRVLLGGTTGGDVRTNLYGPPPGSTAEASPPGLPGVTVATAWGWPSKESLASADVVVAYTGTGGRWNRERIAGVDALLDRGAGFVAIHSAVITGPELAGELAARLGLVWQDGITTFRHGPVHLDVRALEHPICLGLPARIRFEDETYWPLVGDASKVDVLATADERMPPAGGSPAPQPMLWTFRRGKGRAVGCLLGHYTWTFDDPYVRILLLRAIAWAAGESPFRFDPRVLTGARTGDAAPAAMPRERPAVTAKAPDPKTPRLLLWLDASDRSALSLDPGGLVSGWSSRAGAGRVLSSSGDQRPRYVSEAIGSRPAVRFDGKDDILRDTEFRRTVVDWSLLMVAAIRSNAGGFRALFAANSTGKNDYVSGINLDLGGGSTAAFDVLNLEGVQHEGQSSLKHEPVPFGAHVVTVVRGAGRARAYVDGLAEGVRTSRDVPASLEEIRVGGRIFQNPPGRLPLVEQGFLEGDIAEVILFAAALDDEERAGVEAYLLEKYEVHAAGGPLPTLDEAFERLPSYDPAKGRYALNPIDTAIAASSRDRAARSALEARLAALLAAPATADARDFICRRLGRIGTASSVPALASLLADRRLSHSARIALERIGGPEAAAAMRDALARAEGRPRAGIVDSLGRLGGDRDVEVFSRLLDDPDPEVAAAAAGALGRLGALAPLRKAAAREAGPVATAAGWALFDRAWRLLEEGKGEEAVQVFGDLLEGAPEPVRAAARKGLERARERMREP